MEVTCLNCGKKFHRSPSLIRGRTFCSRKCRSNYARQPIICEGCGQTFLRNPKTPERKYCSWECFKHSRWVTVTCFYCGKQFQKRLSEVKKAEENGHKHMCSRDCRNRYTSLLLGGDGEWVEGGKYKRYGEPRKWRRQRMLAIKRDNYMCQSCGATEELEVHHWEPYCIGFDNSLDNLVTLCRECHREMHLMYKWEGFYEDVLRECRWN